MIFLLSGTGGIHTGIRRGCVAACRFMARDIMHEGKKKTGGCFPICLLYNIRSQLDDGKQALPGEESILFPFTCCGRLPRKTEKAVKFPAGLIYCRARIDPERTEEAVRCCGILTGPASG